jgi:uncharacterized protein YkwD
MKNFVLLTLLSLLASAPLYADSSALAAGRLRKCRAGYREQVVQLISQERAARGVGPLTVNRRLMNSAQAHSVLMARTNKLSHDGWIEGIMRAGYSGFFLGQNAAVQARSPESVVAAWVGSPGHLKNILNPNYKDSGVGCIRDARGRSWWTQDFGGPQVD